MPAPISWWRMKVGFPSLSWKVAGLPTSCSRPASRVTRSGGVRAAARRLCPKTSWLCQPPCCIPFPASSAGRIRTSRPQASSRSRPFSAAGARSSLLNSSRMRSMETTGGCSLSASRTMAAWTGGSSWKSRTVAKRTARSIRSGSSSKVACGSSGVTMRRADRSASPRPRRSRTVPSHSMSRVLTVKSLRRTSSSMVPAATWGFRLRGSYCSRRAETNSTT